MKNINIGVLECWLFRTFYHLDEKVLIFVRIIANNLRQRKGNTQHQLDTFSTQVSNDVKLTKIINSREYCVDDKCHQTLFSIEREKKCNEKS